MFSRISNPSGKVCSSNPVQIRQHAVSSSAFNVWQDICVRARDGARLSGWLGWPAQPNGSSLQAVVLVHGFAAERTENGLFTDIGAELVRSGYIVLMYDWRGRGKSEGDFARTSLETHTADLRSVVRWLRRESGLESTRYCAVGFSLGAALVGLALRGGLRPRGHLVLEPSRSPPPQHVAQVQHS